MEELFETDTDTDTDTEVSSDEEVKEVETVENVHSLDCDEQLVLLTNTFLSRLASYKNNDRAIRREKHEKMKKLTQENGTIKSSLESLKTKLRAKLELTKQQQSTINKLTQDTYENEDLKVKNVEQEGRIADLQQKLKTAEDSVRSLTDLSGGKTCAACEIQIHALKASNKSLEKENGVLRSDLGNLKHELSETKQNNVIKVTNLKKELADQLKQFQEDTDNQNRINSEKVEALERSCSYFEKTIKSMSDKNQELVEERKFHASEKQDALARETNFRKQCSASVYGFSSLRLFLGKPEQEFKTEADVNTFLEELKTFITQLKSYKKYFKLIKNAFSEEDEEEYNEEDLAEGLARRIRWVRPFIANIEEVVQDVQDDEQDKTVEEFTTQFLKFNDYLLRPNVLNIVDYLSQYTEEQLAIVVNSPQRIAEVVQKHYSGITTEDAIEKAEDIVFFYFQFQGIISDQLKESLDKRNYFSELVNLYEGLRGMPLSPEYDSDFKNWLDIKIELTTKLKEAFPIMNQIAGNFEDQLDILSAIEHIVHLSRTASDLSEKETGYRQKQSLFDSIDSLQFFRAKVLQALQLDGTDKNGQLQFYTSTDPEKTIKERIENLLHFETTISSTIRKETMEEVENEIGMLAQLKDFLKDLFHISEEDPGTFVKKIAEKIKSMDEFRDKIFTAVSKNAEEDDEETVLKAVQACISKKSPKTAMGGLSKKPFPKLKF